MISIHRSQPGEGSIGSRDWQSHVWGSLALHLPLRRTHRLLSRASTNPGQMEVSYRVKAERSLRAMKCVCVLHVAVVREGLSEEVVTFEQKPEPSAYLREEHTR